jgi:pheromone a factor receptor
VWSFIGFVVVLIPSPWHWRSRNVATLCLIFWLALYNMTRFINSLIWADNYANVVPVWCDISTYQGA